MPDGRRTELVEGIDGPRLVKVASDHDGRLLIAQEAARLRAARHPGIVELIAHDRERLELEWAGERTLELAVLDLDGAAAMLAAVAAIIADLHDVGLVHGRLDPSHVIVAPDGRPRLCGLSGPRGGDPAPTPASDVAALGRLIHRLVGDGITAEPIPERRWRRRRWSGYQQRALQNLADQALADDIEARPTARTLATSIAEVAPGARLARPVAEPDPPESPCPGGSTDSSDPAPEGDSEAAVEPEPAIEPEPVRRDPVTPASRRRPPRWVLAGGAAALTALVAGALVNGLRTEAQPSHGASPTAGLVASVESIPPSTTSTAPTTEAPPSTTIAPHCTPVIGMAADVDDDGCPEPVAIDGSTITVGDIVFRAGEPDDHVTVGDWRCTGVITPGLIRPGTGEVFLFHRWPDSDGPLEADPVAIVPGGTKLMTGGDSCGAPSVESSDGAHTQLHLTEESR